MLKNFSNPDWRDRLRELAALFWRLGCTGFGGPQAHMALMNEAVVAQRGWLTAEELTEGIAVCEMLPGPASTQLGIYIGYCRAGWVGALVAGLCFITPAWLMVVALAWAYFRYGTLPAVSALFLGLSPVVVAIVLAFCWTLGRKLLAGGPNALPRWTIALITFLALRYSNFGVLGLFVLAGLAGMCWFGPGLGRLRAIAPIGLASPLIATLSPEPLAAASLWGWERMGTYGGPLAWFFLRAGTLVFGGGLTIVPLLELEVVQRFGWLTRSEFLHGVAIGQVTPGPVLLTVAFVGYKVAGILGALIAAVAAFLPSFGFVGLAAPLLRRSRQNPWVKAFLQGISPAVLGAIAAVTVPLVQAALLLDRPIGGLTLVMTGLLGGSLVGLLRFRLKAWQLLLVGAIVGLGLGWLPRSW
ncbi:MAG: chromate efflux transporter [Oscillatoriales cyanobacterium]|nr:MAG: chromate efflux transporter [Oscillatoriales cyanobacterium]